MFAWISTTEAQRTQRWHREVKIRSLHKRAGVNPPSLSNFIKTQCGITLLENSITDYAPSFFRHVGFVMMFDNQQPIFGQQAGSMRAKEIENRPVVSSVGRIVKNDVPRFSRVRLFGDEAAQVISRFSFDDFTCASFNPAKFKIRLDERAHRARTIDESGMSRVARERFDPNRSRAGAKIQETRAYDSRRDYVEESFAQTV